MLLIGQVIPQKVLFRLNSESQEGGSHEKMGLRVLLTEVTVSTKVLSEKIREWSDHRKLCIPKSRVWISF